MYPETTDTREDALPFSLLPSVPSFAGHQTFPFRSGWLKKGLDALQSPELGVGALFTREDALTILGVGKNMTQSIRHWLLTTRMACERTTGTRRTLEPTALGKAVFGSPEMEGFDPYLEDDSTLWLLHWMLTGPGSLAFTWVWAFHFFREYEFTRESLTDAIYNAAHNRITKPPSRETVGRDVQCCLHTYITTEPSAVLEDTLDRPLNALNLILPRYAMHYRFQIGAKHTLPTAIFCYALLEFWQWKHPRADTLSLWEIAHAQGSPGVAFKLDEDSVLEYLDEIEMTTQGAWRFEDTALVRQVVRTSLQPLNGLLLLQRHYHG